VVQGSITEEVPPGCIGHCSVQPHPNIRIAPPSIIIGKWQPYKTQINKVTVIKGFPKDGHLSLGSVTGGKMLKTPHCFIKVTYDHPRQG
jgi:hypothetical protein